MFFFFVGPLERGVTPLPGRFEQRHVEQQGMTVDNIIKSSQLRFAVIVC